MDGKMSDQQLSRFEQERLVQAIYMNAADMMKNGMSNYEIEKNLVSKGLDEQVARTIVSNLRAARTKALRDVALKQMAIGGVICIVGLVITIGTYQAAQGGGRYVVAWGAIIFGGFQFFRGLGRLMGID
jgi:hypothetical protein